jgi:hypothetical protein
MMESAGARISHLPIPLPSPRLRLDVPDTAPVGRPVTISLIVEHPGPDALELYLQGRSATFDVEVRDAAGALVWRRLEGAVLQAILQLRVLWPGERFVLHASWDQRDQSGAPVPPGEYRLRGFLLTDAPQPIATEEVAVYIGERG